MNSLGRIAIPESSFGVCVWRFDDGSLLSDGDGYLSLEGIINDKRIEEKMRKAARYWTQSDEGAPHWIRGARKISGLEYEEQQERLISGQIPDPIEEYRLSQRGEGFTK